MTNHQKSNGQTPNGRKSNSRKPNGRKPNGQTSDRSHYNPPRRKQRGEADFNPCYKLLTARQVAAYTLGVCHCYGEHVDDTLHEVLAQVAQSSHPLPQREVALATRLVYGTIQNQTLCDWYLRQFSRIRLKKIDTYVLDCLRLGVYQLLMTDKIPAHAAVNETIELVRAHCTWEPWQMQPSRKRKTGKEAMSSKVDSRTVSFANAVLRRVAQAAETNTLPQLNCPDKESYYALRYSHPEWLVRLLVQQYGLKLTEQICQANNAETPLSLRVNLMRASVEEVLAVLKEQGIPVVQHEDIPEILLCQSGKVTDLELFRQGKVTVQDAASVVVVDVADPQPGMFVLDCCAAPGGKSFLFAERMQCKEPYRSYQGRVYACDIDDKRLQRVREGAERLGLWIFTRRCDATRTPPYKFWLGKADIVLCDVPCSGFGVIRKKPEIRNKPPEEVEALPALQLDILRKCAAYVKPGGLLLYSTCTILERENQAVVRAFLAENPAFEPVSWQHPVCGACPEGWVTLLPPIHHTDGFFIAKMRRKDGALSGIIEEKGQ